MDITQIKHVIEAALLAAGRPLSLDKIASLFTARASELDKETLESALAALASDYEQRGIDLKQVSSGYRIQIRKSMSEWLTPLWEERAPRYTRALLETLALVAYRQPITRAEIEEVRGVAVSTNIMRTLLERNWVRVVGHRDVPGKPAMFGTTREFLDYFGLKRLEDLPPLADIKEGLPELTPQTDLIDALQVDGDEHGAEGESRDDAAESAGGEVQVVLTNASVTDDQSEEEVDGDAEAAISAADVTVRAEASKADTAVERTAAAEDESAEAAEDESVSSAESAKDDLLEGGEHGDEPDAQAVQPAEGDTEDRASAANQEAVVVALETQTGVGDDSGDFDAGGARQETHSAAVVADAVEADEDDGADETEDDLALSRSESN